jgi:hypothetical protein
MVQFVLGASIHLRNLEGDVIEVLPDNHYRVLFKRFWANNKCTNMDESYEKVIHYSDLGLDEFSSDLGVSENGTYIRWSEYFGD